MAAKSLELEEWEKKLAESIDRLVVQMDIRHPYSKLAKLELERFALAIRGAVMCELGEIVTAR